MNTGPAALKMKRMCAKPKEFLKLKCVREAEEFFLIEVPVNVRKIVIVKAQPHGVMISITPFPLFFAIFFHTLLNIILVSNNQ
jgi:hypothetical protein